MAKLSKNPRLLQALQNPRFTQAIDEMKTNPTAALAKYQNDQDVRTMLMDFMGFLGDHFETMGGKGKAPDRPGVRSESDVRRRAIETMQRSPEEEDQVQRILSDPELQQILSDSKMKDILEKCQHHPGALRTYATDPEIGPKLRKLINAGLVQIHP